MSKEQAFLRGFQRGRDNLTAPPRPSVGQPGAIKRFLDNPLTTATGLGLSMISGGGGLARTGMMGSKVQAGASGPLASAITFGAGAMGLGLTALKLFQVMQELAAKAKENAAKAVEETGKTLEKNKEKAEEEEEKRGEAQKKEKESRFAHLIHHPLIQGIGYGSLAAEGAHALGERKVFGKKVQKWTHTPTGRNVGHAGIGLSAAFLGAEGLAALSNLAGR